MTEATIAELTAEAGRLWVQLEQLRRQQAERKTRIKEIEQLFESDCEEGRRAIERLNAIRALVGPEADPRPEIDTDAQEWERTPARYDW